MMAERIVPDIAAPHSEKQKSESKLKCLHSWNLFSIPNLPLIWTSLTRKVKEICKRLQIWFGAYRMSYNWSEEDRKALLEWVRSKAPGCSVSDFSGSWKSGLILVALLEGIVPNTCNCSQYHLLNPKHNIQNVELAFSIARKYLGVYPTLTPQEITLGLQSNESKLIRYIIMLKLAITSHENEYPAQCAITTDHDPLFRNRPCLAKGMGLIMGRKNKPSRFNIYVKHSDQMDLIVEIRGPNGDFCTRRITNRSPRYQNSPIPVKESYHQTMNIDLKYEILGRKVSVTYVPVSSGNHQLDIYWRGCHIECSPYTVFVDQLSPSNGLSKLKSHIPFRRLMSSPTGNPTVKPVTRSEKYHCGQREGIVVSRRVLRQVVLRNGQEIELQDHEPLPHDPKAWCGNTCLAAKLVSPDCDKQISLKFERNGLLTKEINNNFPNPEKEKENEIEVERSGDKSNELTEDAKEETLENDSVESSEESIEKSREAEKESLSFLYEENSNDFDLEEIDEHDVSILDTSLMLNTADIWSSLDSQSMMVHHSSLDVGFSTPDIELPEISAIYEKSQKERPITPFNLTKYLKENEDHKFVSPLSISSSSISDHDQVISDFENDNITDRKMSVSSIVKIRINEWEQIAQVEKSF